MFNILNKLDHSCFYFFKFSQGKNFKGELNLGVGGGGGGGGGPPFSVRDPVWKERVIINIFFRM